MSYTILNIDSSDKHRKVLRNFIEKAHPGVELVEHDPSVNGMPGKDTDWSKYQLLIIDNDLGGTDGLAWFKEAKQQADFPPAIFVSSMSDPGTARATQAVIEAVRLGAENFLFKKGIVAKQLNSSILSVLEAAGYDPDTTLREMEDTLSPDPRQRAIEKTLGTGTREIELSMNDTVLEMELAMAMLHGYAEWPFSMRDILAGKVWAGDYKITSYLGKTDHISTFKATRGDTPAILKMFSQSLDTQSESYRQAMAWLDGSMTWNHPNLVRYLDHMVIDERTIIVQEFLDGGKLSQKLSRKGVTEEQAVRYIMQILSGLGYLHGKGIVVGEMTPDSLILRDPETLVISNPGIINQLNPVEDIAKDHIMCAQLCYTTPETVQGLQVDRRSDLYTAGTILYEMIAGHPPFHRGSIQDILYAHATLPVPDLPDKKHPLNRVIQGLLKKTPAQRYQSAQEVVDAVQQIYGLSS